MLRSPVLEVNDVKVYVDGRTILKGVNLVIGEGEIHAILGPNGAGKSTLARLIMGVDGFLSPSHGEIIYRGTLVNGMSVYERAKLGIVLAWQEPVRFEGITVEEFLRISAKGNDTDIEECLSKVGLAPDIYLSRFLDDSLSGGERKRVELASILAMRPGLAVLDEPDSGIDFASISEISDVIKAIRDGGATVLMVTHREEVAEIADVASLMCDGRIIQSGRPEDVGNKFKKMCMTCEIRKPELVGGNGEV